MIEKLRNNKEASLKAEDFVQKIRTFVQKNRAEYDWNREQRK